MAAQIDFVTEPEADFTTLTYILRRQVRDMKRFKATKPYHSERRCEDKTRCAFHRRQV